MIEQGQRFGRLVVVGDSGSRHGHGRPKFLCRCDCGRRVKFGAAALLNRSARQCWACDLPPASSPKIPPTPRPRDPRVPRSGRPHQSPPIF